MVKERFDLVKRGQIRSLGLALHICADGLRYRVKAFIKLRLVTAHQGFDLRLSGVGDGGRAFAALFHFRNDNVHIAFIKRPEYAGIAFYLRFDGSLGVGFVGVGFSYVDQHLSPILQTACRPLKTLPVFTNIFVVEKGIDLVYLIHFHSQALLKQVAYGVVKNEQSAGGKTPRSRFSIGKRQHRRVLIQAKGIGVCFFRTQHYCTDFCRRRHLSQLVHLFVG